MLGILGILIVSFTVLANLFIAYAVFRRNSNSATHVVLSLLSLSLAMWTVFNYLALSPGSEEVRLLWVRVVMLVTTPFGPFVFLLASAFPESKLNVKKPVLIFLIFISAITAILSLTPFVFSSLENKPDGSFALTPSPGIALFGINFFVFLIWGFYILIKKFTSSSGILKNQLTFFLLGTILSFTLMTLTNFIAVIIFGTIELTFLGPPFTLIMVGMIAYAIVKHKFLDIRLIVARSFSYLILLSLSGVIYSLGLLAIGRIFAYNLALQVTLTLLVAFSFQPLKKILEKATNKIFFQSTPDPDMFLQSIGKIVNETLDLAIFTESVLKKILLDFQLERGIFITNTGSLKVSSIVGDFKDFDLEKFIIKRQLFNKNLTLVEELDDEEARNFLRTNLIFAVLECRNDKNILGYILLGDKKSGREYYGEEIRLLELVALNVGVGLNNTIQFAEIQQFNTKLEQKVEEATHELKSANNQLKVLDERKNEFINMAAHELRAPLTAVKGYTSMVIEGDAGEISKEAKEYLEDANLSNERMIRLVNNLLNVSRIEENRIIYQLEAINLKELAESTFKEFRVEAERKGLQFELVMEDDLVDTVYADRDRLQEVIINFVSNALKYTETGSVKIKLMNTKDQLQGQRIRLEVTDSGPGITLQEQKRLFQKFYRVEASAGKTIGTGLGLYISKLLISKFNGDIGVISQPDQGSTFWFELPINNKGATMNSNGL